MNIREEMWTLVESRSKSLGLYNKIKRHPFSYFYFRDVYLYRSDSDGFYWTPRRSYVKITEILIKDFLTPQIPRLDSSRPSGWWKSYDGLSSPGVVTKVVVSGLLSFIVGVEVYMQYLKVD